MSNYRRKELAKKIAIEISQKTLLPKIYTMKVGDVFEYRDEEEREVYKALIYKEIIDFITETVDDNIVISCKAKNDNGKDYLQIKVTEIYPSQQ